MDRAHDPKSGTVGAVPDDSVGDGRAKESRRPLDAPEPGFARPPAVGLNGAARYRREARRRQLSASDERRICQLLARAAVEVRGRKPSSGMSAVARRICRRRLIEGNLCLVVAISRHYEGLGLSSGDLIQEGNLGLMAAARRFEPRRHRRFVRYAAGRIQQVMCRAVSQQSRTIRIPLRRLELRRWAAQTEADVEQRCGDEECRTGNHRRHTLEDDARAMGMDVETLRSTIRLAPDTVSLDVTLPSGDRPLRDCLADTSEPDPFESAAADEARRGIRDALAHLPPRLRLVVERRYGLRTGRAEGLADIGRDLHVSAERVRQLEAQALGGLRRELTPGLNQGPAFPAAAPR